MYEKITAYLDFFGRDTIPESELQEKTKEFSMDFMQSGFMVSNAMEAMGERAWASKSQLREDAPFLYSLAMIEGISPCDEIYSGRFGGFGPAGCAAGHSEAAEGARRIAVSVWNDRRNCGGRRTRMRAGPATALRGLPGFCRLVTA